MVPIKALSLIKITSEKTGISEDIVEKVINFYYDSLKKKLTNLDFSAFVLERLGKFYIKTRTLEIDVRRFNHHIEKAQSMQEPTPKIESMRRNAIECMIKINKIKVVLDNTKQKKEFITLHKETYKNDKIRKDLEGQVGNIESHI